MKIQVVLAHLVKAVFQPDHNIIDGYNIQTDSVSS